MPTSAAEKAPGSAKGLPDPPGSLQGYRDHPEPEKVELGVLGVKLKGSAKTGHILNLTHEGAVEDIFRTTDPDQAQALLMHCLKVLKADEASDAHKGHDERHFMLSTVNDIAPQDIVERMLAVQMAATHVATVRAGRSLANCETIAQIQAHYTGYTKLARTFAAQVEALRKHRSGGQQKVTVEHVHVHPGGQAIVGHVETGGRGSHER